jgi:hypothetical protein
VCGCGAATVKADATPLPKRELRVPADKSKRAHSATPARSAREPAAGGGSRASVGAHSAKRAHSATPARSAREPAAGGGSRASVGAHSAKRAHSATPARSAATARKPKSQPGKPPRAADRSGSDASEDGDYEDGDDEIVAKKSDTACHQCAVECDEAYLCVAALVVSLPLLPPPSTCSLAMCWSACMRRRREGLRLATAQVWRDGAPDASGRGGRACSVQSQILRGVHDEVLPGADTRGGDEAVRVVSSRLVHPVRGRGAAAHLGVS